MSKAKKFDPYPHRGFTCSDKVWKRIKTAKLKSEKSWTNFLDELLQVYEK